MNKAECKMKVRGFELVKKEARKHPNAEITLPTRGTSKAAAYDIYSPEDYVIAPNTSCMIWTDVKAYMNDEEVLLINVRSSMGKYPVMLANTQGWVDADYYSNIDNDGNIGVRLFNLGSSDYVIKKGDRIAQAMFTVFRVADSGNTDKIREGGFGSTNK